MTTNNFMVDIETLSTRPNATIVSIAIVKFDRNGSLPKLENMEQCYIKVARESCEVLGMHVDDKTMEWWKKQDESVRWEALENPENRLSIKHALDKLSGFIGKGNALVWGNGDDFDCTILGEAYRLCGKTVPWKFWNTRDVRTVLDLANISPWDLPSNDKHHPVHDCYRQIYGIKKAFNQLNLYNE